MVNVSQTERWGVLNASWRGRRRQVYSHFQKEIKSRSAYTALAVATLLNLRTEDVVRGADKWLASCQTFEGGIAGSPTSAEAHGGYAFCVLAAMCMLHPPSEIGNYLDMDSLIVLLLFGWSDSVEMGSNATGSGRGICRTY